MCMFAEALDAEELERYHWWVNSQLDLKGWQWSSPDKAGTEPIRPVYEVSQEIAGFLPSYTLDEKYRRAYDAARALDRPIIFMDRNRNYYDEELNMVMLFDMEGEPTELGKIAIVLPMRVERQVDGDTEL